MLMFFRAKLEEKRKREEEKRIKEEEKRLKEEKDVRLFILFLFLIRQ